MQRQGCNLRNKRTSAPRIARVVGQVMGLDTSAKARARYGHVQEQTLLAMAIYQARNTGASTRHQHSTPSRQRHFLKQGTTSTIEGIDKHIYNITCDCERRTGLPPKSCINMYNSRSTISTFITALPARSALARRVEHVDCCVTVRKSDYHTCIRIKAFAGMAVVWCPALGPAKTCPHRAMLFSYY